MSEIYLRLDLDDELNSGFEPGSVAYVDVAEHRHARREVVFNSHGQVEHRAPDARFKEGKHGIYDTVRFSPEDGQLITPAEFEELWERSDDAALRAPLRRRSRFFLRRNE